MADLPLEETPELIIAGIHAKLLLGKGRFTRREADVLLQAYDALRAQVTAQRERAGKDQPQVSSVGSPGLEVLTWRGKTYVESRRDFLT